MNREQILLDQINALKIQINDLMACNIYLRQAIEEIRKKGFSRSSPYATETKAEKDYSGKVEAMAAHITKNDLLLKSTSRAKNK